MGWTHKTAGGASNRAPDCGERRHRSGGFLALDVARPRFAGHLFIRCKPPSAMPPSPPPAVTSALALRTVRDDFWRFDSAAAWPDPAGPGPKTVATLDGERGTLRDSP